MQPSFVSGSDAVRSWRASVEAKEPPKLYALPVEFKGLEIGPGLIALIGGAPGQGKTALAMQAVFGALEKDPSLRVIVCNVELSPEMLLDRELARRAKLNAKMIRYRSWGPQEAIAISQAMEELEPLVSRIAFAKPPYSTLNIATIADEFGGNMLVLDYLQRLTPAEKSADRRGSVDNLMNDLRNLANEGSLGIIALSAIRRGVDRGGKVSYSAGSVGLSSFRESSELEFGADSAWILTEGDEPGESVLRCFKNRYGEVADILLWFDPHFMQFRERSLPKAWEGLGDDF